MDDAEAVVGLEQVWLEGEDLLELASRLRPLLPGHERSGDEPLCSRLLAAGANSRLRGRDRATAGDIAESRGFTALAKRLRG